MGGFLYGRPVKKKQPPPQKNKTKKNNQKNNNEYLTIAWPFKAPD